MDIISYELNLSKTIVHGILTGNQRMKRLASKVVPRILSDEQKMKRLNNSKEMLLKIQKNPELLKRVITGDESWVYGYDPETKQMSSRWLTSTEPPPKKVKSQKSAVKCMLVLFFYYKGVVYYEWLPKGMTVTASYYITVLHRLKDTVQKKRPELAASGWLLHHDNISSLSWNR